MCARTWASRRGYGTVDASPKLEESSDRAFAKFGGTQQIANPRNRASSQGRGGGGTMAGAAAKTGGLRLFKLMEIDEIDETEQVPWLSSWE